MRSDGKESLTRGAVETLSHQHRGEGLRYGLARGASPPALTSGELKSKLHFIQSHGEFPSQAQQIHGFTCHHRRVQAGRDAWHPPVQPIHSLVLPKDTQVALQTQLPKTSLWSLQPKGLSLSYLGQGGRLVLLKPSMQTIKVSLTARPPSQPALLRDLQVHPGLCCAQRQTQNHAFPPSVPQNKQHHIPRETTSVLQHSTLWHLLFINRTFALILSEVPKTPPSKGDHQQWCHQTLPLPQARTSTSTCPTAASDHSPSICTCFCSWWQ